MHPITKERKDGHRQPRTRFTFVTYLLCRFWSDFNTFDTRALGGPESVFAQTEFENSDRLPWKSGDRWKDGHRQPRTFMGWTQAALDVWEGHRQPRTYGTDTGSLGIWDGHRHPRTDTGILDLFMAWRHAIYDVMTSEWRQADVSRSQSRSQWDSIISHPWQFNWTDILLIL